MQDELINILM